MSAEQPLNIVHVVRQFRPSIGGLENFVEQLAATQAAKGQKVSVVTLDRVFNSEEARTLPSEEEYGEIRVSRIPYWGSTRYPIATKVIGKLSQADIIHIHGVDFFCDFLALTKGLHRKTMVLTTHGGFFHTDFARRIKRAFFNTITRLSLTRYAAVVTCSNSDTEEFRRIRPSGLVEIPNAVDVKKFAALANPLAKHVVYFGRLAPNKEISKLIRWFAGLYRRDPEWSLTIAGRPSGLEPQELEAEIEAHNIQRRATIVSTPSDTELAEIIATASVFGCASSYEGFGLAAVEAASAGLYPLLNDIPPFNETIKKLGFGQILNFSDPGSFQHSYAELEAGLSAFRSTFDQKALSATVAGFSWDRAANEYERVYLSALGRTERRIGNVRIDVVSESKAVLSIQNAVRSSQGHLFTFANAHTVNIAAQCPRLAKVLEHATVLNDGVGADIASRLLYGAAFPKNLNGTDLTPKILDGLEPGTKVFLLGSTDSIAKIAAKNLADRHPHLEIVGHHSGFFDIDSEEAVADLIARSTAQVVLVGMGQPLQEIWAEKHLVNLGKTVICVGAFLDFSASAVKRAPLMWRRLRMEWIFRLIQEPRRLAGRYLAGNLTFLIRVLNQYAAGYRL